MAVTTEKSTQVTNLDASPVVLPPVDEYGARIMYSLGQFTQGALAGDANSLFDLAKMPPGARVLPQSRVFFSAFGTSRTVDVGFTAHTEADNTVVAAVVDKFIDGLDVSSVGDGFFGSGTNADDDFQFVEEIKEGEVVIQGKVLGGTIPAAATFNLHALYAKD